MAVRKPKVQSVHVRTCEKMTLQRAAQLAEYGMRSAVMAKLRGKSTVWADKNLKSDKITICNSNANDDKQ